ncbi:MAG: hypothetical protein R3A44_04265 [Caldilineaceae bacterium]
MASAGYDPDYGARPLRRVIQNSIQDPLSEAILEGRFVPGDTILLDYQKVTREDGSTADDYTFEVSDHHVIDEVESEAADAIEAMLQ